MISGRSRVVFVSAALCGLVSSGCGGKTDNPPTQSGVEYECFGRIKDNSGAFVTNTAGKDVTYPVAGKLEVVACSAINPPKTDADSDKIAAACETQCNTKITDYVSSLSENERPDWSSCQNNTPAP